MRKSILLAASATTVLSVALAQGAALAATRHPTARHGDVAASSSSPAASPSSPAATTAPSGSAGTAQGGTDPDTTVTFTVTSGALSITAPTTAFLGSGAPGTTISSPLGAVTVTDNEAALSASWAVQASATDFTTGGGTPAETIPPTDVGYDPGTIATTLIVTATGTAITLSSTPTNVVTATGTGDDTATWSPTIAVHVPASAVAGLYTGTLTESFA